MDKAALCKTSEQMGVVCANIDVVVLECVRMTVAMNVCELSGT